MSPQMPLQAPSVAIIGTGVAGLTLANLLSKSGIEFSIFDLRPAPSSTATFLPSGSLDLHEDSGLAAIHACGLYEDFMQHVRQSCEDTRIGNSSGEIIYQDNGFENYKRPEIDRSRLAHVLLENLPVSSIFWESKVESVLPNLDGTWSVKLAGRKSKTFDLVIGADGAWSKVRPALTDVTPIYGGVQCLTFTIPDVDTAFPAVSELCGSGSAMFCGGSKALVTQRGGAPDSQTYLRVYTFLRSDADDLLQTTGMINMTISELKSQLLSKPDMFADWGEDMKSIISAASEDPAHREPPRSLYMLPIGHTWTSRPGVALIGDAAHLMTPFAGEGANAAMYDAVVLAKEISAFVHGNESQSLHEAVGRYEVEMWTRTKESAEQTWQGRENMFATDAPKGLVEMFESFGPPADMHIEGP